MSKKTYRIFSLQQLIGAAERMLSRTDRDQALDMFGTIEDLRDRLANKEFVSRPLCGFIKKGKKPRLLLKPDSTDYLLHQVLHVVLTDLMEPLWPDSVHGFRRGRSTFSAAAALAKALKAGRRFVLQTDIKDFFPSINREILATKLNKIISEEMTEVILALIDAPIRLKGKECENPGGLPLGLPISPILGNYYLIDLDLGIQDPNTTYLRYGDDIAVASITPESRNQAEMIVVEKLEELRLRLNPEKHNAFEYRDKPFVYLGHIVDETGIYQKISKSRLEGIVSGAGSAAKNKGGAEDPAVIGDPSGRSQTLYVTEPGIYLKTVQGQIVMVKGKEVLKEVPLHRVDRILILAGASFSSGFMSACISRNIPVLFFVGKGRAFGSLVTGGMPNPLRLQAQYGLYDDPARRLILAQDVIDAKIRAMAARLQSLPKGCHILNALEEARKKVYPTSDIQELIGVEGSATRAYYQGFALRINEKPFAYTKRTKRPPRDPVNSLLSFSYSLIFGEMQTSLLAHGLDPYPGFLHSLHRNHPALASDLIEPYRSLTADSFVLMLINNHSMKAEDFERQSNGGVYIKQEPRRKFLQAYEGYMNRDAGGKGAGTPRQLIHAAARAMLRVVLGETESLTLPLTGSQVEEYELEPIEITQVGGKE